MRRSANAKWMLVASMAIFGTLGPFVRNIGVSSGELALYRAILAAALIGVYLVVTRQRIPLRGILRQVPLLLISGMAGPRSYCSSLAAASSSCVGIRPSKEISPR